VTAALLLGALPGVYVGARLSAQAPSAVIRPIVSAVLLASALTLVAAPIALIVTGAAGGALLTAALAAPHRAAREPAEPASAGA